MINTATFNLHKGRASILLYLHSLYINGYYIFENASAKYKRWFKILPIIQLHSFFYKKAYYLSAGMNNLFYVKLSFCFLYKNMILKEDGIII